MVRAGKICASRAAAENIIPHTTVLQSDWLGDPGTQRQTERSCPARTGENRLGNGTGRHSGQKVTVEEVNAALKKSDTGNKSFGYTDEEIVSSDVIGSHFGSVFDATQTEVTEAGELQPESRRPV